MGSKGKGRDKEKVKDMRVNLVAGVKEEVKKNKTYFFCFENIRGRTRFEDNTATVPRQRRQKCLLVFLNVHRIIRKRTEIPL